MEKDILEDPWRGGLKKLKNKNMYVGLAQAIVFAYTIWRKEEYQVPTLSESARAFILWLTVFYLIVSIIVFIASIAFTCIQRTVIFSDITWLL